MNGRWAYHSSATHAAAITWPIFKAIHFSRRELRKDFAIRNPAPRQLNSAWKQTRHQPRPYTPFVFARPINTSCVYRKLHPSLLSNGSGQVGAMIALICFVLAVPASPFKSKSRLEAELTCCNKIEIRERVVPPRIEPALPKARGPKRRLIIILGSGGSRRDHNSARDRSSRRGAQQSQSAAQLDAAYSPTVGRSGLDRAQGGQPV